MRDPELKRAQIKADCPYFVRLGDRAIICAGPVFHGKIEFRFLLRSARTEWFRTYCTRYASGARCKYAEACERGCEKALPSLETIKDERAGEELIPTVVTSAARIVPFLSGSSPELVLPDAAIYRHVFSGVRRRTPTLVRLIVAGEKKGAVVKAAVRRRRAGSGWQWVIERA